MGAIELENAGMIERHHPVNPIMAIQAIRAYLFLVHLQFDRILLVMTANTTLRIKGLE